MYIDYKRIRAKALKGKIGISLVCISSLVLSVHLIVVLVQLCKLPTFFGDHRDVDG